LSTAFEVGQRVIKEGEDSKFEGVIVCRFYKRDDRTVRYVVENDDGILHIASPKMLKEINNAKDTRTTETK
jgi:hypothetical protein